MRRQMRNILLANFQRETRGPFDQHVQNQGEYERAALVHEVNDIIAPICIFNYAPC